MLNTIVTKGRTVIGIVAATSYDGDDSNTDKYKTKIKVRIPEFHGPRPDDKDNLPDSFKDNRTYYIEDKDLPWIPVCLPIGYRVDMSGEDLSTLFEVDEMVYVTFTDDSYNSPIVIGTTGRYVDGVTVGGSVWIMTSELGGLTFSGGGNIPTGVTGSPDGTFINPVPNGYVVSSDYGYRIHPISGVKKFHPGIDMAASTGTPIVAIRDATVIMAQWYGGYGNCVVLQHEGIKSGQPRFSLYGHCSRLYVRSGQKVKSGNTIALMGTTGNSTGPHLHFGMGNSSTVDNASVNPRSFVPF